MVDLYNQVWTLEGKSTEAQFPHSESWPPPTKPHVATTWPDLAALDQARSPEQVNTNHHNPHSGGRGCLGEGRLGVPGQVREVRLLQSFPSFPMENRSSRNVWENAGKSQTSFFQTSAAFWLTIDHRATLKGSDLRSGGRGCLGEGRLGVPGQVREFRFLPSFPSFPRENWALQWLRLFIFRTKAAHRRHSCTGSFPSCSANTLLELFQPHGREAPGTPFQIFFSGFSRERPF